MLKVNREVDPNNSKRYIHRFFLNDEEVEIGEVGEKHVAKKKPIPLTVYKLEMPVVVETLEGEKLSQAGCWLIEGVRGEMYPCEKEIFAESYEILE